MNDRLLFFILAPIIFKGVIFLLCLFGNWDCWAKIKGKIQFKFILLTSLLVDYITEFCYLATIKDILGVWIFSDEFMNIESYDVYIIFVIYSIIINIFLYICILSDETVRKIPIIAAIFFFIIFLLFNALNSANLNNNIHDNEKNIFLSKEYEMQEDVFYLHTTKDGYNILIADGFLNYSFIDNSGKLVMEKIYNDNNVNIYEVDENSTPKVVRKKYYKSYKTRNNNFNDEYYIYDIYVPSMVECVKIDMD